MRTKTIRVSDRELAIIKKAREQILRHGYGHLESYLGEPMAGLDHLGAVVGAGAKVLLAMLRRDEAR